MLTAFPFLGAGYALANGAEAPPPRWTHRKSASQEAKSAPKLDEVMVSARRTLENAQDVPVAITALCAEQLASYDINNLEKLGATLPDLILNRGNSGSGLNVSRTGRESARYRPEFHEHRHRAIRSVRVNALFAPARTVQLQLTWSP